jgi:AraC-like DNA-binding protein
LGQALTDLNKTVPPTGEASVSASPRSGMRVAPLFALASRLRACGIDPAQAFAEAGLGAEVPTDPEQPVPYREATALFAVCVRLTGEQDFALRAGMSLGLAALGLPGDLARNSPTVGDALRALSAHFRLHDQGGGVVLDVHDGIASLMYLIHEPGAQAVDQIADFALAIACGLMRDLCGADWRPSLVRFAHREPSDRAPYRDLFGSRLEFDSPADGLLFAASWLALPISNADPRRLDDLSRRAAGLERDDRISWVQRLRATLRAGLAFRECAIEQVSAVIGIHRRTLERRLRDEGTTFTEQLDAARHDLAIQLLENTRLPMTEIADALDFSDPAVFSRAFRRWRGTTPSTWRAQRVSAQT